MVSVYFRRLLGSAFISLGHHEKEINSFAALVKGLSGEFPPAWTNGSTTPQCHLSSPGKVSLNFPSN